jgi:2OG-Fe(II) oxygenase superfamily
MVHVGTVGCRVTLLCIFLTSTGSALIGSAAIHRRNAESTRLRAAPFLRGVAAAGISKEELKSLEQAFVFACQDQLVGFNLDDVAILPEAASRSVPGATGRVLLLTQSNVPDDEIQDLQCAIASEIDELLYADPPCLSQPVLIAIETNAPPSRANLLRHLQELVTRTVEVYEMAVPLPRKEAGPSKQLQELKPTVRVEVDGAMVTGSSGERFWDTSSVLVFDNVISDDLRTRLLDVVVGREDFEDDPWDWTNDGPDPRRWVRGGLIDIPGQEGQPCWGLSDEAIDDLCLHHDAFEEFESIVSGIFPQFSVSRLPEAVLGDSVSPMTANAPTHGDVFTYHIDGDPNMTPPSPWTDVYGRYPNRQPGKPRLLSCLVYLNDEWKDEWGAPTRFLDVATDTHYDIQPKPGRCVFMDQDITHTVVAPEEAAGKRPRYSLVWKLIFHPMVHGQDMNVGGVDWPEPILLGSSQK